MSSEHAKKKFEGARPSKGMAGSYLIRLCDSMDIEHRITFKEHIHKSICKKQNTLKIQKDLRLGDYSVEERRCNLYNFLNNLGDWAVFISSGTSVHSSLPLK